MSSIVDSFTNNGQFLSPSYVVEPDDCFDNPSARTDVNECTRVLHDCHTKADCINTVGSFNCSCQEGWLGNGTHCVNEDECQRPEPVCQANATCTDTEGRFICSCKQGYVGTGQDCIGTWCLAPSAFCILLAFILNYKNKEFRTTQQIKYLIFISIGFTSDQATSLSLIYRVFSQSCCHPAWQWQLIDTLSFHYQGRRYPVPYVL